MIDVGLALLRFLPGVDEEAVAVELGRGLGLDVLVDGPDAAGPWVNRSNLNIRGNSGLRSAGTGTLLIRQLLILVYALDLRANSVLPLKTLLF